MTTERRIDYQAAGRDLVGVMYTPEGPGPAPSVLIAHEGLGQSDHERTVGRQLADCGYLVFVLDYHGDGAQVSDRDDATARLGVLMADHELTRSLAQAALDILTAEERCDRRNVAAIGYCFGGQMALELGRSGAPLAAIVGFHASLATTADVSDAANIACPVLVCMGADDPIVDASQRTTFEAEMRAGDVDWQLLIFGGAEHTFTNPAAEFVDIPGIRYDEQSARRAWNAMLAMFDETIGRPALGT